MSQEEPEVWVPYSCTLSIEGIPVDPVPTVYSGGSFDVDVELEFIDDIELESARLVLQFRVHGSGSPETHELVQRTLARGVQRPGDQVAESYTVSVPETAPMTYEGIYVKISWSLRIEYRDPNGQLHYDEYPLMVKPRPAEWDFVYEDPGPEAETAVFVTSSMAVDLRHLRSETAEPEPEAEAVEDERPAVFSVADPPLDEAEEIRVADPLDPETAESLEGSVEGDAGADSEADIDEEEPREEDSSEESEAKR